MYSLFSEENCPVTGCLNVVDCWLWLERGEMRSQVNEGTTRTPRSVCPGALAITYSSEKEEHGWLELITYVAQVDLELILIPLPLIPKCPTGFIF